MTILIKDTPKDQVKLISQGKKKAFVHLEEPRFERIYQTWKETKKSPALIFEGDKEKKKYQIEYMEPFHFKEIIGSDFIAKQCGFSGYEDLRSTLLDLYNYEIMYDKKKLYYVEITKS